MKSFIKVDETSHFPIQNLPYGVFSTESDSQRRIGVAIGDYVLDLSVLEKEGFFKGIIREADVFSQPVLNVFMEQGKEIWQKVRRELQKLLSANEPTLRDNHELRKKALIFRKEVTLHLPVKIGDYTDFYASKDHASNVGMMFRGKENALMPNWTHLPVGYHGRSSTVILSGKKIRRPLGQIKPPNGSPIFAPTGQLDFELEMGCIIGTENKHGEPIPIEEAENYVFGMVLVNDWSARDIQSWEYQPLGPFLSKSFATSISPWVVPLEALEPFRIEGPVQEPKPLEYLQQRNPGSFNIQLEAYLKSEKMETPKRVTTTNYRYLYWSIAQQIAHHTIGGCSLIPGDLLASGTISGPEKDSRGCLLELTWRGQEPIVLNDSEQRQWLEDGDELTITGWCQGDGYRVGFGEVSGVIEPALNKEYVLKREKSNFINH